MLAQLSGMPTSIALPTSHHFHLSLSPVVSLSLGILHERIRTQMLAKPFLNLLQRTGGDHRDSRAQPGWKTFMMTCLRWILRSGAKSAPLQTDVFAQCYALIVVHATIGLDPTAPLAAISKGIMQVGLLHSTAITTVNWSTETNSKCKNMFLVFFRQRHPDFSVLNTFVANISSY